MQNSRFKIVRDQRAAAGWIVLEMPTALFEPARAIAVFADWQDAIRWAQERANPWRGIGRPAYVNFHVKDWARARAAMKTMENREARGLR